MVGRIPQFGDADDKDRVADALEAEDTLDESLGSADDTLDLTPHMINDPEVRAIHLRDLMGRRILAVIDGKKVNLETLNELKQIIKSEIIAAKEYGRSDSIEYLERLLRKIDKREAELRKSEPAKRKRGFISMDLNENTEIPDDWQYCIIEIETPGISSIHLKEAEKYQEDSSLKIVKLPRQKLYIVTKREGKESTADQALRNLFKKLNTEKTKISLEFLDGIENPNIDEDEISYGKTG